MKQKHTLNGGETTYPDPELLARLIDAIKTRDTQTSEVHFNECDEDVRHIEHQIGVLNRVLTILSDLDRN